MRFFGFVSTVGISSSKDSSSSSSSSSLPVSTSARDSSTGSMSSPMGTASRFRAFVGHTSDALCHTGFPTVDSLSQNSDMHLSHCGFLPTSLTRIHEYSQEGLFYWNMWSKSKRHVKFPTDILKNLYLQSVVHFVVRSVDKRKIFWLFMLRSNRSLGARQHECVVARGMRMSVSLPEVCVVCTWFCESPRFTSCSGPVPSKLCMELIELDDETNEWWL